MCGEDLRDLRRFVQSNSRPMIQEVGVPDRPLPFYEDKHGAIYHIARPPEGTVAAIGTRLLRQMGWFDGRNFEYPSQLRVGEVATSWKRFLSDLRRGRIDPKREKATMRNSIKIISGRVR